MGLARYDIVPIGKQWGVRHDGKINDEYSTKESAFESAAAAASMAIHQGHEVHIIIPSSENSGEESKAIRSTCVFVKGFSSAHPWIGARHEQTA